MFSKPKKRITTFFANCSVQNISYMFEVNGRVVELKNNKYKRARNPQQSVQVVQLSSLPVAPSCTHSQVSPAAPYCSPCSHHVASCQAHPSSVFPLHLPAHSPLNSDMLHPSVLQRLIAEEIEHHPQLRKRQHHWAPRKEGGRGSCHADKKKPKYRKRRRSISSSK
jgi:hypothetical protein